MARDILKELPELVKAGLLTGDAAERIQQYYDSRTGQGRNRLLIAFGILGAVLVGLGIILIIAHNWDEFPRPLKTSFSFLPLLIGQVACGYTLLRKHESPAWRESTAAFLFFAAGASISLVSQVYNIPGNMASFMLTWMVLCLPLIYLMNSSVISLLFFAGIANYAMESGSLVQSILFGKGPENFPSVAYWSLFIAALPHYYRQFKKNPQSNFVIFHNWVVPASMTIAFISLGFRQENLVPLGLMNLFGLLLLLGGQEGLRERKLFNNGYLVLGSLGTLITLLVLSFEWYWEDLADDYLPVGALATPGFITAVIFAMLAAGLLIRVIRNNLLSVRLHELAFIIFIIIFLIGLAAPDIAWLMTNLLVFGLGIFTVRNGARSDHLGVMNYGLLTVTALIICRFFDLDLTYVVRGVLFVLVGAGFFAANMMLLKKRKTR